MEIPNIYHGDYKRLAIIPIAIIILAIMFIPSIKLGVDFKGGTLVSINTNGTVDTQALTHSLELAGMSQADVKQYNLPIGNEVEIEVPLDDNLTKTEQLKTDFFANVDDVSRLEADAAMYQENSTYGTADQKTQAIAKYTSARASLDSTANQLFAIAGISTKAEQQPNTDSLRNLISDAYRKINDDYKAKLTEVLSKQVKFESISIQAVSASLSTSFIGKAVSVVIASAILTAIIVFIVFRTFVPSLAVMTGAAADVTIALGAMGLFGVPLTLASFAALMMLISFSLDTDVLLTMRVIKRTGGHAADRAYDSMKTGITMSATAFIAFTVLLVLGILTHINTYYEIAAVALAGLVGDIFATWGINAVVVLWYAEKQEKLKKEKEEHVLSTIYK